MFTGESVLGGLEVGPGSFGAPPAASKSGCPQFLPALTFLSQAHWGLDCGHLSTVA